MGTLLWGVSIIMWKAYDKGRTTVIFVPEVPGAKADVRRVRLTKNEVRMKVQGTEGEQERVICSEQSHYQSSKGPLFLIGQSTGWNLVAPSKLDAPKILDAKLRADGEAAKTASQDMYARMLVADPLCYERAIEQNDFSDFVNSKQEKDPWQVRIAGMVIILLLGVLFVAGGVVYLITKLPHGGGG